jgi:ABC-type multidrug transport system ATPase subunit
MAIINDGRVLAAGTVKGLKKSQDETLEDVFIRLVGRSIEDVEGDDADAESDGVNEEE